MAYSFKLNLWGFPGNYNYLTSSIKIHKVVMRTKKLPNVTAKDLFCHYAASDFCLPETYFKKTKWQKYS